MRSGGRRGLQIRRSGAVGVRGGFDSHAFPPIAAGLVAVVMACAPSPAAAQSATVRADSTVARDSSMAPPSAGSGADTTRSHFDIVPAPPDTSYAEAERVL